jgi:hypothetical protein
MQFYTPERLGPNRARTPEGYLLCTNVPLARTGMQEYGPGETPIKAAGRDQMVRIYRHADEVFNPDSLASYTGKPFTDEHPVEDVNPDNWPDLAKGIVLSARRGTGPRDGFVIGDILVTDRQLIKDIEANEKVEVSVGYDAQYDEIGPGEGIQRDIIVNHVALVGAARCGPACSIGDHAPRKDKPMATMDKMRDMMRRAFKAKDESELDAIMKDAPMETAEGQNIHIHLPGAAAVTGAAAPPKLPGTGATPKDEGMEPGAGDNPLEARLTKLEQMVAELLQKLGAGAAAPPNGGDNPDLAGDRRGRDNETEEERAERERKEREVKDDETIEGALEMEAPPGTDDKAFRAAKDSRYLGDAFERTVSQCAILFPDAKFPTFDAKERKARTFSMICGMRTEALQRAFTGDAALREAIMNLSGGRQPDFAKMTCDAKGVMLGVLVNQRGKQNNRGAEPAGFGAFAAREGYGGGSGVVGKIATPADLNKLAKQLYAKT